MIKLNIDKSQYYLLACSGGLDSMVLCHLLWANKFKFAIAHCNFQLRGQESEDDMLFVETMALQYKVPLHVKRFDVKSVKSKEKLSTQEAARTLRYNWFNELKTSHSYNYLLTAHHANDNLETVLINMIRGSGLAGLKGIPFQNSVALRPLIASSQEEIKKYALQKGLAWRQDSSNATDDYKRNFIRHHLYPLLKQLNPSIEKTVYKNSLHLQDSYAISQEYCNLFAPQVLDISKDILKINCDKLLNIKGQETLLQHMLQPYGFNETTVLEIAQKLSQSANSIYYSSDRSYVILMNSKYIRLNISSRLSPNDLEVIVEKNATEVDFIGGKLLLITKKYTGDIIKDQDYATFDASKIQFPLILRKAKTGDYLYPLGMKGKKLISNLLTDLKYDQLEKNETWIIESDKKIAWVIGIRTDNRFKVDNATKKVVLVKFQRQANETN